MSFLFRECGFYLFSNAGTQAKPICLSRKSRSGVRRKAYIEGGFVVSRGDMGVLFWGKRHPHRMLRGQRFSLIHVRPSWCPPNETNAIPRN
jgi:hypothetical protein